MNYANPWKRLKFLWSIGLLSCLGAGSAMAQTVDIKIVESSTPGTLELRVRPDQTLNELVSELTFTLRWETASGASLGAINQILGADLCPLFTCPLSKSGNGEVDFTDGFRYQTFSAFPQTQLQNCNTQPGYTWPGGVETVIMTIPVTNNTGCANFEFSDVDYDGSGNTGFFLSYNSLAATGAPFGGPASIGSCNTDCNGDVGGTASIDQCGVCSGGNTGLIPNESCTDCNGEINGTASIDQCGVCSGGSTGLIPDASCTDCNGDVNGTASIDQCGVCSGGNTGL
ncbi:MAG: hypothetical protein KDB88_06245, partial [Flavobacteriales bacterium]|nr:hypothetical protein [Flavobacteriales bacterium]